MKGSKYELLREGIAIAARFCKINNIPLPIITTHTGKSNFSQCAYYRAGHIHIWPDSCAHLGTGGRAWSWPGHSVDRTPYGVVQHELGHHVDTLFSGARWKLLERGYGYSAQAYRLSREAPLTGYSPNVAEWFAEMFRLYVTNPDLLKNIRPLIYATLSKRLDPAVSADWRTVLADAPERTMQVLEKRVK